MATPSTEAVPADVVLEIMARARLPVKSLMRLRLLSKSFFSITASPNFITSHLALSKSSGYVALPSPILNPPQSFIAIFNKSFFKILRPEIPFSFSPRPRSESFGFEGIYFLVGSCNGLLCVTDDRREYLGRVVVLWNPMIGKFKSISDTTLDSDMLRDTRTRITLGFGYDEKNDDYKIVRLVNLPDETETRAEIYSLKTNSWKMVIFPIHFNNIVHIESYRCSFVHGALHWLVHALDETNSRMSPAIFSFKIDDEQFKVIRLPPNYNSGLDPYCSTELMVLKESLALTVFYEFLEYEEVIERCWVWKMKKYEEAESWTKQILPISQVSDIYGFTEDGELMFRKNYFEVNLYNLDTGALKESIMLRNFEYVAIFHESLVLL